jgi:hypothetical protein
MTEGKSSTFNTIFALGVVLFFFTITGFIFILATRLFTRITKLPSIISCIWVGAAIWWIAIPFIQPPDESLPKGPGEIIGAGYDYVITGTAIKLVNPPKTGRTLRAYYGDEANRHIKLHLHGGIDGFNQTYQLSTNKNSVLAPKTTDNIGLEIDDWALGQPRTATREYHETHDYKISKWFWTLIIVGFGIGYYIMEQCRAFTPATP